MANADDTTDNETQGAPDPAPEPADRGTRDPTERERREVEIATPKGARTTTLIEPEWMRPWRRRAGAKRVLPARCWKMDPKPANRGPLRLIHPHVAAFRARKRRPMQESPYSYVRRWRRHAYSIIDTLKHGRPREKKSAATRLIYLSAFAHMRPRDLMKRPYLVRPKHVLNLVALESGYDSWRDFKQRVMRPLDPYGIDFCPPGIIPPTPHWYVFYGEAQQRLKNWGGYLFPYGHQFFVCQAGHVARLGVDPDAEDWKRIGYDWLRPGDRLARERLARIFLVAQKRRSSSRYP